VDTLYGRGVARGSSDDPRSRLGRLRDRIADAASWTPPTSTEIGTVAKSALAAGVAWALAATVTGVDVAVLAALTSMLVVQVNVRASLSAALQRTAAVVLGVLTALAIGDALELSAVTVALIVGVTLGLTRLVLRLPPAAARQVPVSVLVVLTTVASSTSVSGLRRAGETVLGAAVGVAVSLLLPASRLVDARQTLQRLGDGVGDVLRSMAAALQSTWSTEDTAGWRRSSRLARDLLVADAREAVGNGRDAARWNVRDRRHMAELGRYEDVLPCIERTAIGVWSLARGLDDHARLAPSAHAAMPAMGSLLGSLAAALDTLVRHVLGHATNGDVVASLDEVQVRRDRCMHGASRRAQLALAHRDDEARDGVEGEWLGFVSLLVQVDRIVADVRAQVAPQ
jgi:hypothetical protein